MKTIIYYAYLVKYYLTLNIKLTFENDEFEYELLRAQLYSLLTHHSVRQYYDKKYPYFYHIRMVLSFINQFKDVLTPSEYRVVFIAATGHDFIEDCRLTYNDVMEKYGTEIADIIYACTDSKGKNRKERHDVNFVKGLQNSTLAIYTKMCDICANMTMGKKTKSSMLNKYRKEYTTTKNNFYKEEYKTIFSYLENNLLQ